MPGHMNVLLAEADVPYDQLLDLDESNPVAPDRCRVGRRRQRRGEPVGTRRPSSPIYGMPILEVDKPQPAL